MTEQNRDDAIEDIQRELTAFARRARTVAAQMHPGLSLVAYSILDMISERGGARGSDLAAHFLLDKSTVSRQVGNLERLGLVERRIDPGDHRGQILLPTEDGARMLADAYRRRKEIFVRRFTDWDDEDLDRLAGYLRRYNASGPAPGDQEPDPADAGRTPSAG
ncbi:MarR family transcriptional regulator [Mangrovactinospora gilvigrisea]|uniref:MarR family transcriptional regulator n=1 Tax=Mangrovactinospora gilvigrisea TaxID=1428644 RepID=A0A1J7C435_9ACTN|nr:MarR family transcriptional regulator [Mangrovactinospora gilvigrisea]OIV36332.1 MarR family transcriptional regulator [Mangrovactinospora gilvigrisea]